MRSNILRLFIKHTLKESNLLEADRFTRETGSRFNMQQDLEKYVDVFENGIAKYAFTMTSIPKLGLNPRYKYNNPRGIYAYPLTSKIFQQLKNDKLPFVSNAPYFSVFEIKDTQNMLNVSSESGYENHKEICQLLYNIAASSYDLKVKSLSDSKILSFNYIYNEAEQATPYWDVNDAAKIYGFTYWLVYYINKNENNKKQKAAIWTNILRKFGYSGIYDAEDGIIHSAEPTQLVVFSKQSIKSVGMFETAAFRKRNEPDLETQKTMAASKTISPEILDKLSYSNDIFTKASVAENQRTRIDTLERLSKSSSITILKGLARNQNISWQILDKLANIQSDDLIFYIVHNRNVASQTLDKIVENDIDDEQILKKIAKNKGISLKTMSRLSSSVFDSVKICVAQNEATKPEIFEKLANSNYYDVLIAVAENPSTPTHILNKFLSYEHFDGMIKSKAKENLESKKY